MFWREPWFHDIALKNFLAVMAQVVIGIECCKMHKFKPASGTEVNDILWCVFLDVRVECRRILVVDQIDQGPQRTRIGSGNDQTAIRPQQAPAFLKEPIDAGEVENVDVRYVDGILVLHMFEDFRECPNFCV